MKQISKKNIIIYSLIGVVLIICIACFTMYNSMTKQNEAVNEAWSQVENVYQRRADLIPQLVKTVQGAADFEKTTLDAVIQARSEATSMQIDPSKMSAEDLAKFQGLQDNLSSSLSRLMVVVERYPELKATENFKTLQGQLEGTENRIAVERKKFNEVTRKYNTTIKLFPKNIIANMLNFDERPYFKATEGADRAPEVEFNF